MIRHRSTLKLLNHVVSGIVIGMTLVGCSQSQPEPTSFVLTPSPLRIDTTQIPTVLPPSPTPPQLTPNPHTATPRTSADVPAIRTVVDIPTPFVALAPESPTPPSEVVARRTAVALNDRDGKWKRLSSQQLQRFIQEKGISPLMIAEIEETFSVVMYRTPDDVGYYQLNTDDRGEIGYTWVSTKHWYTDNEPDEVPVSLLVSPAMFSDIVAFTINDPVLIRDTTTAKVFFTDSTDVSVALNGIPAAIVSSKWSNQLRTHTKVIAVALYDASGQEIHRQPF